MKKQNRLGLLIFATTTAISGASYAADAPGFLQDYNNFRLNQLADPSLEFHMTEAHAATIMHVHFKKIDQPLELPAPTADEEALYQLHGNL